ncbi:hypothetical protein GJ496_004100 [Pomphorhynchus laevis]|nr:hypothetical protein GJ496_004100 [Pomphorhynchus laevis]
MNKSSDDTLFNWRLRIKIHRGQQLFGENLYPICQVRFGSSVRSTSIQDCLSDPVWQEELTILSEFNKQNFEKQIISIEINIHVLENS